MNPTIKPCSIRRERPFAVAIGALALAAALGAPGLAQAQAPYDKAEQAADAVIMGLATSDEVALATALGKGWRPLLGLEDINIENRFIFLEKAGQSRTITINDGRARLTVGSDPWTLPIPIVQGKDGKWRFDPDAGREEILERRIGANELAAMQAVLAAVDAQREYAQKIVSSPGKRDGLIWSEKLGDESPLGEEFLPPKPNAGYYGYRFRILTGQGPKAPGGARSYLIGGRMVAGFAFVARPVTYGDTGVMSFMVNSNGDLYERDFGPQTAQAVEAIKLFNPDEGWKPVKP